MKLKMYLDLMPASNSEAGRGSATAMHALMQDDLPIMWQTQYHMPAESSEQRLP